MNNMFDTSRSNESKFNGYVNYGIWKFKINNILLKENLWALVGPL
jgi:hypothetical protein